MSEDISRSKAIRGKRKLTWMHRLNILIPSGLNVIDRDAEPKESRSGLNKLPLAHCINTVQHTDVIIELFRLTGHTTY